MVFLVIIGSIYTVNSNPEEIDFCVWGFGCDEEPGIIIPGEDWKIYLDEMLKIVPINEFSDYNFTEDGTVDYSYGEEEFFKVLVKVINVSKSNYQEVITTVSEGDSFDEIYHLNIRIFIKNYTRDIDYSSKTGEYIQNIGEIVLNGY